LPRNLVAYLIISGYFSLNHAVSFDSSKSSNVSTGFNALLTSPSGTSKTLATSLTTPLSLNY